jgi:predicted transposase/invertase (TIGR01784 family)
VCWYYAIDKQCLIVIPWQGKKMYIHLRPPTHSNTGSEAYIYLLLEHQSSPDPLMAFRLLEYTVQAIEQHIRKHRTTKIPLIYPLVVYHGKLPFRHSNNINDLVDAPRELVDNYFLKPFQLLDLGKIDDEVMKKNAWSGIMEFVLKHIYAPDMLQYLYDIQTIMIYLDQHGGRDYLGIVLQYVIKESTLTDRNTFIELINKNLSKETGENIMSLAQQWRAEGVLEGKLEGKIETARNMLAEGCDPVFIVKVTGLTLLEIQAIQEKII